MSAYLSEQLLDAIAATGQTRSSLARAVAPLVGATERYVALLIAPGHAIPVDDQGRHTIVSAICDHIAFPVERALSASPPPRCADAVERRYRAALAEIRARGHRLTDEDASARRGSPFGSGMADDDAA